MLIASLLEPISANVGDFWYCLSDQKLYEFNQFLTLGSTNWIAVVPNPYVSIHPHPIMANGRPFHEIWIDLNDPNQIPHLWDLRARGWISVVPTNFNFPPLRPIAGDMWMHSLSLETYMYMGLSGWTSVGVAGLGSMPITAGAAAGGGAGNIVLTGSGGATGASTHHGPLYGNNVTVNTAPSTLLTIASPSSTSAIRIDGLVDIKRDGTIVYEPGYTPNAAAKQLWEAIGHYVPASSKEVAELRSRLLYAENHGFKWPEQQKPIDPLDAWDAAMGIIAP